MSWRNEDFSPRGGKIRARQATVAALGVPVDGVLADFGVGGLGGTHGRVGMVVVGLVAAGALREALRAVRRFRRLGSAGVFGGVRVTWVALAATAGPQRSVDVLCGTGRRRVALARLWSLPALRNASKRYRPERGSERLLHKVGVEAADARLR